MHCIGKVGDQEVIIIIDSGAVSNIINNSLLKKINWKIQRPSNINLVGINGIKERPLGEVVDLPINLGKKNLKINALVTEKGDYDLLLGNDWAHKNQAVVNWKTRTLTFEFNNEKVQIPVSCLNKREQLINSLISTKDGIQIKVFTNNGKGKLPEKAHETDAGFDMRYPGKEILNILPYEASFVNTHVAMEIPTGSFCQLKSRSSLIKKGIKVKAGIIDAGYTGDIGIYLFNNSNTTQQIQPNERIAQAIFLPLINISNLKEVNTREELGQTSRGQNGFESTGTDKLLNILEEYEEKYEEKDLEDQPLLKILEEMEQQVILDIEVKEHYTQIKDQQIYHATVEEMRRNALNGNNKCPHTNDEDNNENCLHCVEDEELYRQMELIPEPLFQSTNIEETDLTEKQQQQLDELLAEYHDLFDNEIPGKTDIIQHEINLEDTKPIALKPYYRRSPLEKEFIQDEIDKMLRQGIIKPSDSPWTAPVVVVKKKEGKLRFCVDYRQLNKVTTKDQFPLPRIDDLLDTLGKAKYFSTLDLASGYWQVEIKPEDRPKTAFITTEGLYEFNVMPFGLTNAPATFQRLMNKVFKNQLNKFVIIYLDDTNVYSTTFEDHLLHLRIVFDKLRQSGLKLQPSKCHFGKTSLAFLGHVISKDGIKPDPAKISAVKNFPKPHNLTVLRGFLGLASYYRRFVKDFAKIAAPLHQLMRKDQPFIWTTEHQEVFEELKHRLISAPILIYPDFDKPFILYTDASSFGLGAVLSQKAEDEKEHVVTYASKRTDNTQKNYYASELECLAVVWAIQLFRPYLQSNIPFTLVTDHSALKGLFNKSKISGKLARWIMTLNEYNFKIEHRKGRIHSNVDPLF
jgi:deoxyuridine 5'-triphosphate nucleotidohydrolase